MSRLYFIGFSRQLQKRLPDDFNEFSAKQTPTKFFVFQTSGQKMEGFKGRPRRSRFATLRGKNFCPPSLGACLPLADSDFSAAAEFRISQSKMRRQEKRCCVYPALPCVHNKFTPFIIITYFGLYHNRIYNTSRHVKVNLF